MLERDTMGGCFERLNPQKDPHLSAILLLEFCL
jgi:hypothetical protein